MDVDSPQEHQKAIIAHGALYLRENGFCTQTDEARSATSSNASRISGLRR